MGTAKVRVVLTAGYNRALHVITLAELLRRQGHVVGGVLVVSPYQIKRALSLINQRGIGVLRTSTYKLLGRRVDGPRDVRQLWNEFNVSDSLLSDWCNKHGVPYLSVNDLNDANAVGFIQQAKVDGVIYGGGGIVRKDFLSAAHGRVLNAHSGPLPEVRGMNACEWSILLGLKPTVTIHLIDRGIDTGPTLDTLPIAIEPDDTIQTLREKCTIAGVKGILRNVERIADVNVTRSERSGMLCRQCFVLAPALREVLAEKLARMTREQHRCG